jgi:predicted ribonuclease YlaK
MRGINLDKKILIVDECQNMTVPIIKRIISRAHDSCKVVVLGCLAQTDIPISKSGFKEFIDHMRDYEGCVKCDLPISYRGRLAMHIDKL